MQNEPERLTIGKSAKYLGVSIDSLRRWEKKGFITSHRSPGGHRYYVRSELRSIQHQKPARILSEVPVEVSNRPKHRVHPTVITLFVVFLAIDLILAIVYSLLRH